MREFFKGWRRKMGCVSLVLACVLMVGARRSYFVPDMLQLPSRGASFNWMTSSNGIVDWTTIAPLDPGVQLMGTEEKLELMTAVVVSLATENMNSGKEFVSDVRTASLRSTSWRIPYWSIVLPLALLSAYLLLSKPRVPAPKKISDPAPVEETWIMRDFFHGWRRRAGCVTLVMALMFAAFWMRSLSYQDKLTIPIHKHTQHWIVSGKGVIGWARYCDIHSETAGVQWQQRWLSVSDAKTFEVDSELSAYFNWHRYGFGVAEPFFSPNINVTGTVWVFPYWSIVLPLTLLSAYLLLSNKRKATLPVSQPNPTSTL